MSRTPPSPRQQAALLHIRGQLLVTSRPPTLRQLGRLLGIGYRAAACLVDGLVRKGWVRRPAPGARWVELVDDDGPRGAQGERDDRQERE